MPRTRTAIAAALGALALTSGCGGAAPAPPLDERLDVAAVGGLLDGVPQDGLVLGRPDAPDALAVYADPDSLRHSRFATDALPELVRRHVRPGRLRLVLNPAEPPAPLAVDGATRSAVEDMLAAARQDRLWAFALLYQQVGTGVYDGRLGQRVARRVPGLDLAHFNRDAQSQALAMEVRAAERRFARAPGDLPLLRLDPRGAGTDDVVPLPIDEVPPAELLDEIRAGFGYRAG